MSETNDPVNDSPQIIGATDDELPDNMRDVSHVIAYNVREDELADPSKLKARWVWTVTTGKRAQDLERRQAAVILKILEWYRDHRLETQKGPENAHGSTGKAD